MKSVARPTPGSKCDLEHPAREGESPVLAPKCRVAWDVLGESGCLGVQLKVGGGFLLRLNTGKRPIANKYREGKMKRSPKGE